MNGRNVKKNWNPVDVNFLTSTDVVQNVNIIIMFLFSIQVAMDNLRLCYIKLIFEQF